LTNREKRRLEKLKIKNLKDLFYYFPSRYEDFSKICEISKVKEGETVTVKGWLVKIENFFTKSRKYCLTEATIEDEKGEIKAVWYNQPFLNKYLKKGGLYYFSGKVIKKNEKLIIPNPNFEQIPIKNLFFKEEKNFIHTGRIVPIYPEAKRIKTKWIREVIFKSLENLPKIEDFLPKEIISKENLLNLKEALLEIHFPSSLEKLEKARKRFAFEEIFLIQLAVLRAKLNFKKQRAYKIPISLEEIRKLINSLPFELTNAQKKAVFQILKDMEKEQPMNRLLQGDVGSGKTIVALIPAYNCSVFGFQSVFLVPTEILAKQHFKNIKEIVEKFGKKVGILTKSQKTSLKEIEEGKIDIVIGTHALLNEKIKFKKLGFVVVDEQHRFGVEQRAKLIESQVKNQNNIFPHFLSMTATPIPRTLALTFYGDLDFSILDEMPKGRKKPLTKVFEPKDLKEVLKLIKEEIMNGGKVFFVCPRIEMKQKGRLISEVRALKEEQKRLLKFFPEFTIKIIHGKMKEKEKIMEEFEEGKIDILLATNVIEEGIDVQNATLIVIQNAERFGLAQLYQLRGRVGRGEKEGKCFLITSLPTEKSAKRMEAFLKAENAFQLAEEDLKIRGPGDFLGKRQAGAFKLKVASLTDVDLIQNSREMAKEILKKDPTLKSFPFLKKEVEEISREIYLT
jgi:ATP-dependent DNA helicase RecG